MLQKEMTPEAIVAHLKNNLRARHRGLFDEETLNESIFTRDNDPGEWCGANGLVWISFESGLPSPYYETYMYDILFSMMPPGYFMELINPAVAVIYEA